MRLSVAPSTKRVLVQQAKVSLRAILPWPMVAWCEGLYFAQYGEIELRLVRHLCRPDRDSIDVGANVGTYLHGMRRHSRRVYAFEPVPWLAQALTKKFRRDIVVETVALSRETSEAVLHVPVIDGAPVTGLSTLSDELAAQEVPCHEIPVATRPLDEVYGGDVGFIKIDVEGHEQAVLDGAIETMRRCRPRVLVEVLDRLSPGGIARARAYFDALDYVGYFVHDGFLKPIGQFSIERMQDPANYPDLAAPLTARRRFDRFIYNFIFLPREEAKPVVAALADRLTTLREEDSAT